MKLYYKDIFPKKSCVKNPFENMVKFTLEEVEDKFAIPYLN